jgi:hypothetical protein
MLSVLRSKLIAAIETATNNVDLMSDEDMRRIGNAACFLTAAITRERERRGA